MHQEREHPGRDIGSDIVNPDFVTFVRTYGMVAERVAATQDFEAALDRVLDAAGSALIELVTEPDIITARTTLTTLRAAVLKRQAEMQP